MKQKSQMDLDTANDAAQMLRARKVVAYSLHQLKQRQNHYNPQALQEALTEAHNLAILTRKCLDTKVSTKTANTVLKAQAATLRAKLDKLNFSSEDPFSEQLCEHTDCLPRGQKGTP